MKKTGIFVAVLALVISVTGALILWDQNRNYDNDLVGIEMHKHDRCPRSALLMAEPSGSPWYPTITPSEAFSSERTHTFPHTCALSEIAGTGPVTVKTRTIRGLPGIYNVVTRNRGELFALGGATMSTETCTADEDSCATGPFVAKIDAHSLGILWKTQIHDAKKEGDWDYPGVVGVHGNGYVYLVNGYHMAKIDPANGAILKRLQLPTPEGRKPGDTVYNGFSILSDGHLVAKSMTRKKGATADSIRALLFHHDEDVPSIIAVVEPENLKLVVAETVNEPVLGRISNTVFKDVDYIYVSGLNNLFRYIYRNNRVTLDQQWGPVQYCAGRQKPGTAPAVFGEFVVVQTNFQLSWAPLSLTAVSQADDGKVFHFAPFAGRRWLPGSLQWSLPTVDVENRRIYAYDFLKGRLAAIDFDADKGFSTAWTVKQRSLSFAAIMGPPNNRTLVLDDANPPSLATVRVVWRDAATGKELARSPALPQGAGLPIAPGFEGVMYYPSHKGMLTELSF
jgi:hypothetical protein